MNFQDFEIPEFNSPRKQLFKFLYVLVLLLLVFAALAMFYFSRLKRRLRSMLSSALVAVTETPNLESKQQRKASIYGDDRLIMT